MAGPDPLVSNHRVTWTDEHQERLDLLIHQLTSPPVMAFPDFTKPFVLHTDASQEGIGAVLYQEQDGKLRVLGYASRTLTPADGPSLTNSTTIYTTPPPLPFTPTTTHLLTYYRQPSCLQWGIGGWQNWQISILTSNIGQGRPTSMQMYYLAYQ